MKQGNDNTIRVALIARSTLYRVPGGDTVQMMQTAAALNKEGICADIKLTNEPIDYNKYDLFHFFNVTRPADILHHAKSSRKQFIISPIYIDYSLYDKHFRGGISGMLFKYLSSDACEYLKAVMRKIKGNDSLTSFSYLWKGQKASVKEILQKASMVLPNSSSEYNRLKNSYDTSFQHLVVPNGIDPKLFALKDNVKRDHDLVICVARIEGVKNQLNLIKALNNTRYRLLLIGNPAPNQMGYYEECKRIAADNVEFIDYLPQHALPCYYQRAGIHILPSFFETTGLSSLEAAAMGCKVIVTDKGDTVEYFGDLAGYCDPCCPESILLAVETARTQAYSHKLREKVLSEYTWDNASVSILRAYKKVIESNEAVEWNLGYSLSTQ
jgi:glycosyltransferase involved in cell wall biosynthesis